MREAAAVAERPVIIIGAPRSGTNMLRNALCRLPGVHTWPCDEINPIWRHGNLRWSSDAIPPEGATEYVSFFVRRSFLRMARRSHAVHLVEKTCANSLRVEFVNRIFPGARYVFLWRDGLDVVGSALQRWTAPFDLGYSIRKMQYVPLSDLPYYGWRFASNRLRQLATPDRRLGFWGPQLENMSELLATHSLEAVCAIQWRECVMRSARAFEGVARHRVVEVAYEDLVRSPATEFKRLVEALSIDATDADLTAAIREIGGTSVGKGRSQLGEKRVSELLPLIEPLLRRYGYV